MFCIGEEPPRSFRLGVTTPLGLSIDRGWTSFTSSSASSFQSQNFQHLLFFWLHCLQRIQHFIRDMHDSNVLQQGVSWANLSDLIADNRLFDNFDGIFHFGIRWWRAQRCCVPTHRMPSLCYSPLQNADGSRTAFDLKISLNWNTLDKMFKL